MAEASRPLSPHLQVYRWYLTMALSIAHRVTGAGLAVGLQPLVSGYGPALLDRAVFDALCRHRGLSFSQAMRANLAGMGAHAVVPLGAEERMAGWT